MKIPEPLSSSKWIVLILIIVFASFLRLYNIPQTVQFLGDQGRDARIVSDIFKYGDLVFIGPVTSVGNMYLGPLYYYFMAPWLWLSYPNPLGPVYAVAVLGIVTVGLTYWLGKELVGARAALFATAITAFSSVAITYSRFSWNPNPAPLVSLLLIYCTYKAWSSSVRWWLGAAICFSILIQLHYLTLLSAAGAGLILTFQVVEMWHSKKTKVLSPTKLVATYKKLLLILGISSVVFFASLTPLALFDYKHEWLNSRAFYELLFTEPNFSDHQTSGLEKSLLTLRETHGRSMHILFEITIGQQRQLNTLLVLVVFGIIGYRLWSRSGNQTWQGEVVLTSYLVTGILGAAVYEHTIFDHYIAYLFPVTFLTLGVCLAWLSQRGVVGKITTAATLIYFLHVNVPKYDIFQTLGWTISDIQRVSTSIAERVSQDEKYNIVLLSETGDIDAQNYRYFLEASATPPVRTEKRGEVETLFIINEDRKLERVTDSPVYEIVVFPDKTPDEVYTIPGGPEITVLRK